MRSTPCLSIRVLALLGAAFVYLSSVGLSAAQGVQLSLDTTLYPQYLRDLRALSMGNAFSAVARGPTALFYNPAGLAQSNVSFQIGALGRIEGANLDFILDTRKLANKASEKEVEDYLNKYTGTTTTFRTEVLATGTVQYREFGIGGGLYAQSLLSLRFADGGQPGFDLTGDSLEVAHTELRQTIAGFGGNLQDGRILGGIALRQVNYRYSTAGAGYFQVVRSRTIDLTVTEIARGEGLAIDAGMMYRFGTPKNYHAQVAFVLRDIGSTELEHRGRFVMNVPATYHLAGAYQLDYGPIHLLMSAELDDLTSAGKYYVPNYGYGKRDWKQRSHLGMEAGLFEFAGSNLLNLRAGLNRGRITFGVELNLFSLVHLNYVRWGDDVGHSNRSEPRTYTSMSLGIGLAF